MKDRDTKIIIILFIALFLINQILSDSSLSPGDLGIKPNIVLSSYSTLKKGTWIILDDIKYGLWDIRNNNDNSLVCMILTDPNTGTQIFKQDLMKKAFAIRLSIELAHLIDRSRDYVEYIQQKFSEILDSIRKIVEDIPQLKKATDSLKESWNMISSRVNIDVNIGDYARILLDDRSDQNAKFFLSNLLNLIVSSFTPQNRATFIVTLAIKTFLHINGGSDLNWTLNFLSSLTNGNSSVLDALISSYGNFEVLRTIT